MIQDVAAVVGVAVVVTSAGGTYDNTNFPILGDNNGSIRQNVTLTFTSSTAFTILGCL